ncbi:hypothetical protein BGZ46_003602 [Entomortierella lignicola]|nr:hypothetical protein BGZ46_003602 [Entomortierella lignicola]
MGRRLVVISMDILSRVPVEIAFQILSKLDIEDIASCQCVSRQWYWITMDQSIWRNVLLEHEKVFAIPITNYGSSTLFPVTSTRPMTCTTIQTSGAVAVATTTTTTPNTTTMPTSLPSPSPSDLNAQSHSVINWKQKCRTRVLSNRNWRNGHIQSLFKLTVHRGGIVRLRIKGSKLLSGDSLGTVAIWDTTTFDFEGLIDVASGPIQLLDFSETAMVMTVISKSGICEIWDLKTKSRIRSSSAAGVVCMTMNDEYLVLEWDPLYKSLNKDFIIDPHRELPPNLTKAPHVHKTKIPPISTITSIAIGGNHPHVLIANADRQSLDGSIRVCPPPLRYLSKQAQQNQQEQWWDAVETMQELAITDHSVIPATVEENVGVILTSPSDEITDYLEHCGLKPSFMDVDDDVIVVGTSKGDILAMTMIPQE